MFNLRLLHIYTIIYLIFTALFITILIILSKKNEITTNINQGILILVFILLSILIYSAPRFCKSLPAKDLERNGSSRAG